MEAGIRLVYEAYERSERGDVSIEPTPAAAQLQAELERTTQLLAEAYAHKKQLHEAEEDRQHKEDELASLAITEADTEMLAAKCAARVHELLQMRKEPVLHEHELDELHELDSRLALKFRFLDWQTEGPFQYAYEFECFVRRLLTVYQHFTFETIERPYNVIAATARAREHKNHYGPHTYRVHPAQLAP